MPASKLFSDSNSASKPHIYADFLVAASPNTKLTTLHEEQMGSSTALDLSPHEEECDEDDEEEVSTKTQVLVEGRIEEPTSESQVAPNTDGTSFQSDVDGTQSETLDSSRLEADAEVETLTGGPSDLSADHDDSSIEEEEVDEMVKDEVKQEDTISSGAASSENLLDTDMGTLSEPELESYQVLFFNVLSLLFFCIKFDYSPTYFLPYSHQVKSGSLDQKACKVMPSSRTLDSIVELQSGKIWTPSSSSR